MTSKAAPGAVPSGVGPPDSDLFAKPLTSFQDHDTLTSHDCDVTMVESTYKFENAMYMVDLGGGAVTPPSGAASVPIPEELAQAIKVELKPSEGTIDEPTWALMICCHDPSALTRH